MIKNIFIGLFIFFMITANAQRNRRNRIQNITPVQNTKQKLPEVNVEKAVGLTFYDLEKVTKKLGIKDSSEEYNKISSVFNNFNKSQKELARIHSFSFSQIKEKIKNAQKTVLKNRDYSVLEKAYKEVGETFKPITKQIEEKEKKLDDSLSAILSEKKFKKWKKLQTKIKRKS